MKGLTFTLSVLLQVFASNSFIIPDELPSLLSVIYSNIPTIKKGTDSRFGWGFRLGDRADFQVLTELGPQTYTQPLANQQDRGTSKRASINTLSNTLYAQRFRDKQQRKPQVNQISDTEGGKWLENWSKTMQQQQPATVLPEARPGLAIGEIDAKSVIPDDSASQLSQMFGKERGAAVTTPRPKVKPTSKKEALDNVDLD